MKLSKNEKEVLKLLLDNGRVSDIDMAKKLNISTQAVGKIRKKLEHNGVITGYSCNLDLEKLGLNQLAVTMSNIKGKFWNDLGEMKGRELLRDIPPTIFSCVPSGSDVSFISLRAFRDAKEMDRYFHITKVKNHEYGEVMKVYSFSTLNLLKNNPANLFKLILDDKPIVPPYLDELKK